MSQSSSIQVDSNLFFVLLSRVRRKRGREHDSIVIGGSHKSSGEGRGRKQVCVSTTHRHDFENYPSIESDQILERIRDGLASMRANDNTMSSLSPNATRLCGPISMRYSRLPDGRVSRCFRIGRETKERRIRADIWENYEDRYRLSMGAIPNAKLSLLIITDPSPSLYRPISFLLSPRSSFQASLHHDPSARTTRGSTDEGSTKRNNELPSSSPPQRFGVNRNRISRERRLEAIREVFTPSCEGTSTGEG